MNDVKQLHVYTDFHNKQVGLQCGKPVRIEPDSKNQDETHELKK